MSPQDPPGQSFIWVILILITYAKILFFKQGCIQAACRWTYLRGPHSAHSTELASSEARAQPGWPLALHGVAPEGMVKSGLLWSPTVRKNTAWGTLLGTSPRQETCCWPSWVPDTPPLHASVSLSEVVGVGELWRGVREAVGMKGHGLQSQPRLATWGFRRIQLVSGTQDPSRHIGKTHAEGWERPLLLSPGHPSSGARAPGPPKWLAPSLSSRATRRKMPGSHMALPYAIPSPPPFSLPLLSLPPDVPFCLMSTQLPFLPLRASPHLPWLQGPALCTCTRQVLALLSPSLFLQHVPLQPP